MTSGIVTVEGEGEGEGEGWKVGVTKSVRASNVACDAHVEKGRLCASPCRAASHSGSIGSHLMSDVYVYVYVHMYVYVYVYVYVHVHVHVCVYDVQSPTGSAWVPT